VGLVAITPAAGFISPMSALALGAIAAVPSYFAIILRSKTSVDDSLDVVAAHGVGGTVGALLTGVFAEKGLNVKKYPMCYGVHRALDGMLDLIREHKLTADGVKEIAVTTGKTQATMLRNHRPQTGLEAKFSMEFAMASALTAGRAGLSELTDGFVRRPEVQSAMGKVRIATTDTVAEDDPVFAARNGTARDVVGGAIFGSSLILLYLMSTLYHAFRGFRVKKVLWAGCEMVSITACFQP